MATEQQLVTPRTVKGCLDLLPEEVIQRKAVLSVIEQVYQKYGFSPIESPALEYLETLLGAGGEETNKELFRLESPEGEAIALRFDMTVPFARLLAQYPDRLKIPFRRYACGSVWRGDKPGPGRYRQFTQFDIDAAGSESVAVDAEIVAAMCEALQTLGVPDFVVSINNRKLIDALLQGIQITDVARQKHVLRVIDKLAKVGLDNIRRELGEGRIDDSGDPIPGVHLDEVSIETILRFIGIHSANPSATRAMVLDELASQLPATEVTETALTEMRELDACLSALRISEAHAQFDPSLARGLDYYTGPVFEAVLPSAPEFGSVMGGGRYNRLVERFLEHPIPCTGAAIGVERLLAALQSMGILAATKTLTQVLIVSVGNVPKAEVVRVAAELRAAGLRVETYFGPKMSMKVQLSHADRFAIPVAVILGEDELAKGVVAVKDLQEGKKQRESIEDNAAYRSAGKTAQLTVERANLIETVKGLL